jgi:regulatory protein YycH of two-component signal transduction system YycFG
MADKSINRLKIFIEQDSENKTIYVECDGDNELFATQTKDSKDALKEVNKFIARNLAD